jgi:hypothetical protein
VEITQKSINKNLADGLLSETQSLAHEIANNMVAKKDMSPAKAIDPMTILLIVQVVIQIITFFANLLKNKKTVASDIKSQVKKLNIIQRALIKNRLNHYMKKQGGTTYKTYREYKESVVNHSIVKIGEIEDVRLEKVVSEAVVVQPPE